jgi:hypothetical protein
MTVGTLSKLGNLILIMFILVAVAGVIAYVSQGCK